MERVIHGRLEGVVVDGCLIEHRPRDWMHRQEDLYMPCVAVSTVEPYSMKFVSSSFGLPVLSLLFFFQINIWADVSTVVKDYL